MVVECPMKTNGDGKLYADVETFKKSANFQSIVIFLNNFPYYSHCTCYTHNPIRNQFLHRSQQSFQ